MPPENTTMCPTRCADHSGMEERDDSIDQKHESKYTQLLWVLGICGAVITILVSVLIYMSSGINSGINEVRVSIGKMEMRLENSDKADVTFRKDLEELRRDVELLKAKVK